MKTMIWLIISMSALTFYCLSCDSGKKTDNQTLQKKYMYYEFDEYKYKPDLYLIDGLFVEKNTDSLSLYNYNLDNEIFTEYSEFNYSYIYINDQDSLLFKIKKIKNDNNSFEYDWEFVEMDNKEDSTVIGVQLTPEFYSNTFGNDYTQTIIRYDYLGIGRTLVVGGEKTGCVENYKNIWVHPPRSCLFKILQLNPFPFIQAPYKIGNKWTGDLVIGDFWSDSRWAEWNGSIKNNIFYEITDKKQLKTQVGNLTCFVVEATASSRLGSTYLTAYFHLGEGFLQMDYTNIDGSKIFFKKILNKF